MNLLPPSSKIFSLSLLASLVAASPATAGLLAAWEFNPADVTGATIAPTGGTATNATGELIDNAIIDADALLLDGDGDYLQFANDLTELRGLDSATIVFWFQATVDTTPGSRIIEHEDNFYLFHDGSSFIYTTHGTSGGNAGRAFSTTSPTNGEWQHIAVTTTTGAPAEVYVNGVLEGQSAGNQSAMPTNTQTFQIGARRGGSGNASSFLTGILDDVAIWDEKLSPADIASLAGTAATGYPDRILPTALDTDCNDDGIPDSWYQLYSLDPCSVTITNEDSDLDTLTNAEEFALGTNPTLTDSDDDGIDDNEEITTDPTKADTDDDGLNDKEERDDFFTDPLNPDSDGDTLSDGDEVLTLLTDPNETDSDKDTFSDSIEINSGSDPNDGMSVPLVETTRGLIVYHSFDANTLTSEVFADTSGSANPLNATQSNGGPRTTTGLFQEAADFLGGANSTPSQYADLANGAATLGSLAQGSISAWIKLPSTGLQTNVLTIFSISASSNGSSEARLFVEDDGELTFDIRNDGNRVFLNRANDVGLIDNEWHHVLLSVGNGDGTRLAIYVDGVLSDTGASVFFSAVEGADTASIGRNLDSSSADGQWFFQGAMDDFAIWDRPLNAAEADKIYQEGLLGNSLLQSRNELTITAIERNSSNGNIAITWNSLPGRNYALQFSTTLEAPWNEIDDLTATAASTTIIDTFSNTGEQKGFYRVIELP